MYSDATGADSTEDLAAVLRGRRFVALTGAGCSTESGIPDYRGPETRRRARNPIQFSAYIADETARARYWARSLVGWPRIATARPNAAHRALVDLERAGVLTGVITQNVDRLHRAAGSERVIELHGALAEVSCLSCGAVEPRMSLQERLLALNPNWRGPCTDFAPDGDAEVPSELLTGFRVADCRDCSGALKPRVVFFGENVPQSTVEEALSLLERSEALLIVGSSLTVFSGYRFARRAAALGIPIAIVNRGPTRGDSLACVRVDGRAGVVLPELVAKLSGAVPGAPLRIT